MKKKRNPKFVLPLLAYLENMLPKVSKYTSHPKMRSLETQELLKAKAEDKRAKRLLKNKANNIRCLINNRCSTAAGE